jgi:hypothetical protein
MIILVSKAAIADGVEVPLVTMLALLGSIRLAAPRIDRRGAGRHRFARIECKYVAIDRGRHERS